MDTERFAGWVRWLGFGRLLASALAVVTVCGGAYWLLRTPAPPTEAMLPVTSTTGAGVSTTIPAVQPTQVVVHVAGAVAVPGLYRLHADARVADAVAAAGGPVGDGDPNALNLAQPLVDGSRIYVPRIGEVVELPATQDAGVDVTTAPAGLVNVNTATQAELETLPGVGPATAVAIITERDRNGPFLGVDDLDRVPGIGPARLDALRDLVTT